MVEWCDPPGGFVRLGGGLELSQSRSHEGECRQGGGIFRRRGKDRIDELFARGGAPPATAARAFRRIA